MGWPLTLTAVSLVPEGVALGVLRGIPGEHPLTISDNPLENFILHRGWMGVESSGDLLLGDAGLCAPHETDVQPWASPDRQAGKHQCPGDGGEGKSAHTRTGTHIHGSLARKVSCGRKSLLGHGFLSGLWEPSPGILWEDKRRRQQLPQTAAKLQS